MFLGTSFFEGLGAEVVFGSLSGSTVTIAVVGGQGATLSTQGNLSVVSVSSASLAGVAVASVPGGMNSTTPTGASLAGTPVLYSVDGGLVATSLGATVLGGTAVPPVGGAWGPPGLVGVTLASLAGVAVPAASVLGGLQATTVTVGETGGSVPPVVYTVVDGTLSVAGVTLATLGGTPIAAPPPTTTVDGGMAPTSLSTTILGGIAPPYIPPVVGGLSSVATTQAHVGGQSSLPGGAVYAIVQATGVTSASLGGVAAAPIVNATGGLHAISETLATMSGYALQTTPGALSALGVTVASLGGLPYLQETVPIRGTFRVVIPAAFGAQEPTETQLASGSARIAATDVSVGFVVDLSNVQRGYALASNVPPTATVVSPTSASVIPSVDPAFVSSATVDAQGVTVVCGSGAQPPGGAYTVSIPLQVADDAASIRTITFSVHVDDN